MAIALRDVKLSDPPKCLKWIYLLPNLHRFSYSSTSGFRSRLYKGRNQTTFIPSVSHDMRSIFLNLSKPRSYNSFVKSRAGPKICIKMQDNLEGFLSSELPSHPNLIRGQLENGLRYCILPHKRLPNRFEAHLEVHVGSMHEEEDEQGIAHMTEHVIESEKFSELFYVGATYGAYTYLYGTVYHIHSQVTFKHFGLLPHVLDALNEQAFKPKIRASYLEKERNVVLSELQMWNTIDFRIEGKLCQLLHSENKLNKRYNVLGLEEQIKNWSVAQIKKFHKRWYFPGNATLYIVGDINDVSKTIDAIQEAFGKSKRFQNKRSVEIFKNKGHGHPIRPLTLHNWSLARSNTDDRKPLQIFQHNLIHNFSFYIFSKVIDIVL